MKFLILAALLALGASAQYTCFAPVGQWGQDCASLESLAGYARTRIDYHVQVKNPNSTVECMGVGMGNYIKGSQCKWTFHSLGFLNADSRVSIIWDSNNQYPAIKCKATGQASAVTWFWRAYTPSDGLTCQKTALNKIFLSEEETSIFA